MKRGDELRSGVLQMVKVYIAAKRDLGGRQDGRSARQQGRDRQDSPQKDMPFLADGTPVQILLNPLGVPSRMNVGQILETHLGWAGAVLGFRAITPVFDGADEEVIRIASKRPGCRAAARRSFTTGGPARRSSSFHGGLLLMFKLHHLVDDKVHAR